MKVDKYSGRVLQGPVHDIYVYEAPVRLWHWITVAMMFPLIITGYLIGDPPLPVYVGGEATEIYTFAWVRIIHFACAMIFTVALGMRIYWAFVGNHHARSIFLPPVWRFSWWKGLWDQAMYYLFVNKESPSWIGHNPLAQIAMCAMFFLGSLFIIITGFALYAQQWSWGEGWMFLFSWVHKLFGSTQAVRTAHHLAMYYLIIFSMAHMYMVFREDIMGHESVIGTMVNGIRMFKTKEH
ncbi:MAG: Ni/Fe-hydrogenase, b-type cytochrome subunit [Burkholderiales bacterium]|jgi:Ni/Fe-hydrogenase 1 B-type cytochrome subunit|nr:Ni/Fe-hydrogenase, b-type cytochrome subunit [Burkholderiales bacterium]